MDTKAYFLARYQTEKRSRALAFSRASFNEETAAQYLEAQGVKNFMFFMEPNEPEELADGTVLLSGEIGWDITLNVLLRYVKDDKSIIIDSAGGSLVEGLRIYDGLRLEGGAKIGILGQAASAATLAVLGASESFITENSTFLIHNPYTFTVGDARETRSVADMLESETVRLAEIYAKHSGQSVEAMRDYMDKETSFNASESVRLGFVKELKNTGAKAPEIINQNKDMKAKETKELKSLLDGFGSKLKNLFNGESTVEALVVTDANGTELDFGDSVESVEDIEVGLKGVTVDGKNADGDYVMPDGETYTFSAGELTEIKPAADPEEDPEEDPAPDAEVENLRNELATVRAELETAQAARVQAETELATAREELSASTAKAETVRAEFDKFKNELTSKFKLDTNTPAKPAATPTARVGRRKK